MEANTADSADAPDRYRITDRSTVAVRAIIRDLDSIESDGVEATYSPANLTTAAQRICVAARHDGLYIEQAIVCVKEAWRSSPGRSKPRAGAADTVLDQLVSACIREFYTTQA